MKSSTTKLSMITLLLCVMVLFTTTVWALDYIDEDHRLDCGVWVKNQPASIQEAPYAMGALLKIYWADIEPSPNTWDWTTFDEAITSCTMEGQRYSYMVHTGISAPTWLPDNGVPVFYTYNPDGKTGPWPSYLDPDYNFYFKRMMTKVRDYIVALPTAKRNLLVFHQPTYGSTGDPTPYKGEPLDPSDEITDEEWSAFFKEMTLYTHNLYKDVEPTILRMVNGKGVVGDGDDAAGIAWFDANIPGWWTKTGAIGQSYQMNKEEGDYYALWWNRINLQRPGGYAFRSRAEQSEQSEGWWLDAPNWNQMGCTMICIDFGLDFPCRRVTELSNPYMQESMALLSKYCGRHNPELCPGAICYLKDWLNSADGIRFPKKPYGKVEQDNEKRYENICAAFADHGAEAGDTAALIGGTLMSRNATEMYDCAWDIHEGNYDRYLYQYDPNGTSVGWWRVGEGDPSAYDYSSHGRFARGFEGDMDTMYFDVDDDLFGNNYLNGNYPVVVDVWYYDDGTGDWELRYDSTTGDKRAYLQSKTNTKTWKKKSVTLTDAKFANGCPNGTDLYLNNTDAEDDLFDMVEVTKPTSNYAPYFEIDPITKSTGDVDVAYSDQLHRVDDVFDVNANDTLTFSKQSGPEWLNVAEKGYLSGTPGGGDSGLNTFTVRVSDGSLYDDATLYITVNAGDPPAAPTDLDATPGDGQASLDWNDNTEGDLDGYNVYRSLTSGSGFSKLNASLVSASAYTDSTVNNDTTYFFVVSAVDTSSNESGYSNEAFSCYTTGSGSEDFDVSADTYTRSDNPTNNYGDSDVVQIKSDGPVKNGYLKFVVSGVGTPTVADLKLYSIEVNDTMFVKEISDDSWTEMGLTWTNAPDMGSTIDSKVCSTNSWITFDVSSYINGNGTFSMGLTYSKSNSHDLGAKEGENGATLHIEW